MPITDVPKFILWQYYIYSMFSCVARKTIYCKFIFSATPNLFQAIYELSLVVYAALDYGLDSDTERRLSDELIALFELMTSAVERDTDDEGIEPDHVEDNADAAATPRQNTRYVYYNRVKDLGDIGRIPYVLEASFCS